MIEKIIFSLISLLLFIYVFVFKLIRKNDTTYLTILVIQAIGILINLMQIIFGILIDLFPSIVTMNFLINLFL